MTVFLDAKRLFFLLMVTFFLPSVSAAQILIDQYNIVTSEWELDNSGVFYNYTPAMGSIPGYWEARWIGPAGLAQTRAFHSEDAAVKLGNFGISTTALLANSLCAATGTCPPDTFYDEVDTLFPERHVGVYTWRWATYHLRDRSSTWHGADVTLKAKFVKNKVCPMGWLPVENAKCAREEDLEVADPERECDDSTSCGYGNPINPLTLNKYQIEPDYEGQGVMPLHLVRTYNTSNPTGSLFGAAWRFDYDRRLTQWGDSAVITLANGKRMYATRAPSTTTWSPAYSSDLQRLAQLSGQSDGAAWQLTNVDGSRERFDSHGRMLSIIRLDGMRLKLAYWTESEENNPPVLTGAGKVKAAPIEDMLKSVSDGFGREMRFYYNSENLISYVALPDGKRLLYEYDTQQNLERVTRQDNTVRRYGYSDSLLSDIFDENGKAYAHFSYTYENLQTPTGVQRTLTGASTEHAGGVARWSMKRLYHLNNHTTEATSPMGGVYTFESVVRKGESLPEKITRTCPLQDCLTEVELYSYYVTGRPKTATDAAGYTSTYLYSPDRLLQTSRTEALGTVNERTIKTEWHPTYPLPSLITEPGRTTGYKYDSHVLVKEISVTDVAAEPDVVRTTTLTREYAAGSNPYVTRLTLDGPRSDVPDIVMYDYDTMGNLFKVTRQVSPTSSLITTYTEYDANGRPGKITDPANRVTELKYTARGLLDTHTAGFGTATPSVTRYQYDNVGQLKRLTLPDNSYVEYTYDDAHRLTDITDMAGNYIHYELDNAGNTRDESTNDVNGSLGALMQQAAQVQASSLLPSPGGK